MRRAILLVYLLVFTDNATFEASAFLGSSSGKTQAGGKVGRQQICALYESEKTPFFASITTSPGNKETEDGVGKVVRTAYRKYNSKDSKPSGRKYTTKKDSQAEIEVSKEGIVGDYNHYRTVALNSTPNRAVSLWTTDILALLRGGQYPVEVGDLGENISIEGVNYTYFQVGQQYQFIGENQDNVIGGVILEITERMEPCANLCKLPYINEPSLQPKERIQKCQNLLATLDQQVGMRGWYAKVIQNGIIRPGDKVKLLAQIDEQ